MVWLGYAHWCFYVPVLWGMKRQAVEGRAKQSEYGKREDEAMDGDGVVTMKAHEEKCNGVVCM